MIISLWKWAYTRFISDPQVVADLYVEECDDINNALQCSSCNHVVAPEYAICPNCKAQGTIEMVWYPDIEDDGGDIAFELKEGIPDPEVDARLAWADEPTFVTGTMRAAERMFEECANDCEATLTAAILWSLKQTSKLINTAHLEYTPINIASVIASRVQELNDEVLALQKHEAQLHELVPCEPSDPYDYNADGNQTQILCSQCGGLDDSSKYQSGDRFSHHVGECLCGNAPLRMPKQEVTRSVA